MLLPWYIAIVCLIGYNYEVTSASTLINQGSPLVVASYSEPISPSPNRTNKDGLLSSNSSPLFYGWFFNESTAESISIIGKKYFLFAYDKIPKFQQFINQLMQKDNVTNPLEFYVKPLDPDSGKPDLKYHTTAKFCGRQEIEKNINNLLEEEETSSPEEECNQYLQQVGQYLGRPYRMHLVGLFFTNFTYGIRVKLTAEEQKLFREDIRPNSAQQSESNEIGTFARKEHFSYEPYYYYTQHQGKETGGVNSPFYPGITFLPQTKNFHPTESRAHITLGCAPGILAVQTGLDLLNIVDLEVSSFAQHEDFSVGDGVDIPKAVLREIKVESEKGSYEDAAFVVYPEDKMIADAVFDAYL